MMPSDELFPHEKRLRRDMQACGGFEALRRWLAEA
jgi:hypothetical protein